MSEEKLFTPGKIRTVSGVYIDPLDPAPDVINIEDIAHALSMQPRFGGHLPVFYSVAQHCCSVSLRVPKHLELQALMHDAAEAYLLDIPSPVKNRLDGYKEAEDKLMQVIFGKFNIPYPLHPEVKKADGYALEWEWHILMLKRKSMVFGDLNPLNPKDAKDLFLYKFKILTK